MNRETHLKQQIEQIADTTTGKSCSVIVQMPSGEDLGPFLDAATQAIRLRRSTPNARALVPPSSQDLSIGVSGKLTPSSRKKLEKVGNASSLMMLADSSLNAMTRKDVLTTGKRALKPLMASSVVKKISESPGRTPPAPFFLSGSAALELTRDELTQLAAEVDELADIFPNRRIKVPAVTQADELPHAVKDNTRYTWGVSRTGAMACWGAFGVRGAGVKIAVLDTGFDPEHPDLKGKLAGFAKFGENGDVELDDITKAFDSDSHGTHCAGSIVGGNASGRWIGMAPEARILAAMVLPEGSGSDKQILAGMEWAVAQGADVISLSLGGLRLGPDVLDTYTRSILQANRLGIPVVIAVGNEGSQTSGSPGNDLFAFTVGATDVDDRPAGFSGGRTQIVTKSRYIDEQFLPVVYSKPEVTAPGVDVYSSVPKGKWETYSGTSMATPHVAGAMALLLSSPTLLTPTTTIAALTGTQKVNVIQQLLLSTVKELGEAGQDHRYGYGRIDVLRAFGYALSQGYFGKEFAEK